MMKPKAQPAETPIAERVQDLKNDMLDRISGQFDFDVSEIDDFHYQVKVKNTETMNALSTVAEEIEKGMPWYMATIAIATYGLILCVQTYNLDSLQDTDDIAIAGEHGADELEIKFDEPRTRIAIGALSMSRKLTHAGAIRLALLVGTTSLQMHHRLDDAEPTGPVN